MLAIFDVEGVLYDAEYLPILAETVNKEKEIWDITNKGIKGLINWEDGLQKRVEFLKGISYETCIQVADSLPFTVFNGFIFFRKPIRLPILVGAIVGIMGLGIIFSNELIFNNGELDGVKINVDSDKAKSAQIKINEWDEKKDEITVIVDGANDIKLFDVCGLGIAFRAQDLVKDLATVSLEEKDLSKIIPIINNHYDLKTPLVQS